MRARQDLKILQATSPALSGMSVPQQRRIIEDVICDFTELSSVSYNSVFCSLECTYSAKPILSIKLEKGSISFVPSFFQVFAKDPKLMLLLIKYSLRTDI